VTFRRPVVALVSACLLLGGVPAARAADPDPAAAAAEFAVAGAGFGHGVGMSQWGAYGMAKAGFDAAGIVTHYYANTVVTPVTDDMEARVNLLFQASAAKVRAEALETGGGAIEVTLASGVTLAGPGDEFRFSTEGDQVKIIRVAGGVPSELGLSPTVAVRWAGTRNPGSAGGPATLLDVAGPSTSLTSPGHRYRYGSVEIVPVSTSSGTRLNVVNLVRVHDEYLFGISEVSSSWPAAALQAQVLAARSYALSKVNRGVRQSCSCHVDDGGGPYFDQTFTGWTKVSSAGGGNWADAVRATLASDTTGLAVTYNGQPISAFYCASSGGNTRSSQEAWGGDLPYAVSVPDPYIQTDANPYKAWTVTVSQARMASLFGLGVVTKVEITERATSGALKSVTATGSDGSTVTKSGSSFSSALGLRSTYVLTINGAGGPPVPNAAPAAGTPVTAPVTTPAPAPAAPTGPKVRPRVVSLTMAVAITAKMGAHYRVAGVVRPAKAGLKVWRQVLAKGAWRTVQRSRTDAKGHFKFMAPQTAKAGVRAYRVLVVRRGVVVGVSPQFTVVARR
jgi:SpoIID/LytB domain protein